MTAGRPSLGFRCLAGFDVLLAVLYVTAALWVVLNPASGCTVGGVPCIDVGLGRLFLGIGAPALVLLAVVALGLRQRPKHPRLAWALVAAPPLFLIGLLAAPRLVAMFG